MTRNTLRHHRHPWCNRNLLLLGGTLIGSFLFLQPKLSTPNTTLLWQTVTSNNSSSISTLSSTLKKDVTTNLPTKSSYDNMTVLGRLYVCGFDLWKFGSLIFPDLDPHGRLSVDAVMQSNVNDVLLYTGMQGPCAVNMTFIHFHFEGKVLFVNTEPRKGDPESEKHRWSERFYQIGPSIDDDSGGTVIPFDHVNATDRSSSRHLGVYFGAIFLMATTTKVQQDQFFFRNAHPHDVPAWNERSDAIVFVASNCQPRRQEVAQQLSTILPIHYSPQCPVVTSSSPPGEDGAILPKRSQPIPQLPPRSHYMDNYKLYQQYKYCLVMENTDTTGYVTEKIILAYLAGCIPIYWGNQDVFRLFHPSSMIYLTTSDKDEQQQQANSTEEALSSHHMTTIRKTIILQLQQNDTGSTMILAQGNDTIRDYFSFSDDVGNGILKGRIRTMLTMH